MFSKKRYIINIVEYLLGLRRPGVSYMIFGSPIKLYIQTEKDSYYLGEPVNYNVIVDLKKPRDVKYLKVVLEAVIYGKTTCTYREIGDEEEYETYTAETKFSIPIKSIEQELLRNTKLPAGRHVFPGTIILPLDAPSTGSYGVFNTVWTITAIAPGRLGSTRASKQLTVYPWNNPGPETTVKGSSDNLYAIAKLPEYIPRGTVFPVNVSLYAKSSPIKCDKIETKIIHEVYISENTISATAIDVKECYNINYKKEYSNIKIADNAVIVPNQALTIPLTLSIPHNDLPSFNRGFDYSKWMLVLECKRGIVRREKITFKLNVG